MPYVDYEYYQSEYGGGMPESDFSIACKRAMQYIRSITYLRGDIFEIPNDMVRDAVCAAADVFYAASLKTEQQAAEGHAREVKSESNDGYSVTYVSEQLDGQTYEEVIKRKAYDAVYMYLIPTGWLSRAVRCRHDHECDDYCL